MSYHLDYAAVLSSFYQPVSWPLFSLTLVIPSIIASVLAYQAYRKRKIVFLIAGALPVFLIPLISIISVSHSLVGAGWELDNNQLKIISPPVSDTLILSQTEAQLVDTSDPWLPRIRTNGYGLPGLNTGLFKLKNNQQAIVFMHGIAAKSLILFANNRIYLISHPGVECLYKEAIRNGAQSAP